MQHAQPRPARAFLRAPTHARDANFSAAAGAGRRPCSGAGRMGRSGDCLVGKRSVEWGGAWGTEWSRLLGDMVEVSGAGRWGRVGRARSGRTGASTRAHLRSRMRGSRSPLHAASSVVCVPRGLDLLLSVTATRAGWIGGFFLKYAFLPNCHAKLKGKRKSPSLTPPGAPRPPRLCADATGRSLFDAQPKHGPCVLHNACIVRMPV